MGAMLRLHRPSPTIIAVITVALVLTILEWWLLPTHSWTGTAFTLAHSLLLIGTIWSPAACTSLMVALHIAWMFVTHGDAGTTQLWGMWAALGITAAQSASALTALFPLICTLSTFCERSVVRDQPMSSSLMIAVTYWAAWMIGELVQITGQRNRSRQRQRQLAQQEQLAAQIHDALSAEMSYLMLHMRKDAADPRFDDHARAEFATMAQSASDALRSVRDLVHELTPAEHDEILRAQQCTNQSAVLAEEIRHAESRLHNLGFRGSVELTGDADDVPVTTFALVHRAVHELGANIMRHGEPAPYEMTVDIAERICIDSHNSVRNNGVPVSGTGLDSLRQAVESSGGSVICELNGTIWHTRVVIPNNGLRAK